MRAGMAKLPLHNGKALGSFEDEKAIENGRAKEAHRFERV